MSTDIERRFVPVASGEVRAAPKVAGGAGGIAGTAAVVGTLSENLGGFYEEIAPGAFDKALKVSDIRALFNHSTNYVLGRVKARTMRVWADSKGLHYEIPKMPASRADVLEAIERGDVTGSSFSFRVAERGDSWATRNGQRVRTITEFAEILDVGPVCMPAYNATLVSARALSLAKSDATPKPSPQLQPHAERRKLLDAVLHDNAVSVAAIEDHERQEGERQARAVRRDRHLRILSRIADNDAELAWMNRAAEHEAAHALGYYLDGAGIEAVGLVLEDNPPRCTGGYARAVDVAARSAQSILAGIAAERIAGHTVAADVTDKDVIKAKRAMPPGKRGHEDIEREIRLASDMLSKRWHVVRALAREIVLKIDLTGDEAETVIARALGASIAA